MKEETKSIKLFDDMVRTKRIMLLKEFSEESDTILKFDKFTVKRRRELIDLETEQDRAIVLAALAYLLNKRNEEILK
jgi:hypothetical protein